jgi:hypothetical protein
MRRWITLCALAALCSIAAIVRWPQSSRLTEENVNRIHPGMHRPEIEAILGPPADDSTGPLFDLSESDCFIGQQPLRVADCPEDWLLMVVDSTNLYATNTIWCSDRLVLVVTFHRDGMAWQTTVRHVSRAPQGSLDNLLWRARRLWQHCFPSH